MQTSDLIVSLYRADIPESLTLNQWAEIVRVLKHQQCLARFSWRLQYLGFDTSTLPQHVLNHLKNAEIIAKKQFHQVHYEAAELKKLLGTNTTHLLFLKGAAYSVTDNANVGCGRTYSDIDLLVDKNSIPAIEQELALYGFFAEDLDEYDQKYYREWSHEIPPLRHGSRGTVLDIHHNLLPLISGRAPDISKFFQYTQTTSTGYEVFQPAAMFLHSCIHLFINEEIKHGFRDLTDLALIAEQYQNNEFWQELIELAVSCNFAEELYLALRYTDKILYQSSPEFVIKQLLPYVPNKATLFLLDFIFTRTLKPAHPVFSHWDDHLANFMLLVRGHYLKMPLTMLTKHLLRKGYRQLVTFLLGSNYFDKSN